MNIKRFILAGVAFYITFEILNFIIHTFLLSQSYESLSSLWRPDMMSKMWIMSISTLAFSFLFVYIFSRGFGQGIIAGVKFGLLIGLFVYCFSAVNQYVVYPIPANLVIQWCLYGLVQYTLCGIVVAVIYKPKT